VAPLEVAATSPDPAQTTFVQCWLTRLDTRTLLTGAALFAMFTALFHQLEQPAAAIRLCFGG
jgi:hypothetical protein